MRTIKFRGKTLNKKWVYGDLLHYTNRFESNEANNGSIIVTDYKSKSDNSFKIVLTETVGQFTGLLDKNGKEIYEGDIVHLDTWKPHAMQIAFIEGAFCLADENGAFLGDIYYANHAGINQCTILGNVFDNPELLKGGAE